MPSDAALRTLYDRKNWFEGGEKGGYSSYDEQTESVLPWFREFLNEIEQRVPGRSMLDIGCGYGTHLAIAAERGWKAFGVEVSAHAREVARSRHGSDIYVVDQITSLVPHEFDLILMLDVIEHFKNPYEPFFSLFSKGAIRPKTTVVITTPNAGSSDARREPSKWVYRHPPSHLVYYSRESLTKLLQRLHFTSMKIQGLHPAADNPSASDPKDLSHFAGLLSQASGSDFATFMHERYVPGTWSKLTEYEHLPRYVFASNLARGRDVLDFGSGSGYGAARLAESARSVLGIDIDDAALQWARSVHRFENLTFTKNASLGDDLPDKSFDLITCFEMIEHVDEETQVKAVESFARLLKPDGKLVISTPNPAVTANYGENPFHLRELTESEFEGLLKRFFAHVRILRQWIRPSVTIAVGSAEQATVFFETGSPDAPGLVPVAFIAVCAHSSLEDDGGLQYFDSSIDFIADRTALDRSLDQLRFENFTLSEEVGDRRRQEKVLFQLAAELNAIKASKWFRLRETIQTEPLSLKKIARIGYFTAAIATPKPIRNLLRPAVQNLKDRKSGRSKPAPLQVGEHTYIAKVVRPEEENRPRVLHCIANFMTGGSSRLVIDLFEHLGHLYEQEVITSFVPTPAAYAGVEVREFRYSKNLQREVLREIRRFRPDLIHIHYWGEADHSWYEHVFAAAEASGCPVVENVNTPVRPLLGKSIQKYVFVSDYVNRGFGDGIRSSQRLTIHPGTDFSLFARRDSTPFPENSIGMVYRLEPDKLNRASIDVFIQVIKKRPQTRALIVGGGTLLDFYKRRVAESGLKENFEFTGYVKYETLPALYERLGIFVAPIWKESFGQVSPMAMNMGIPVVGYDVGGLREIVDDPSLLAPAGESAALAGIALGLLNDRERRAEISKRNIARAQSLFSLDAMIANYKQLYEQLLPAKR